VLRSWLEQNQSVTLYVRGRLADSLAHARRALASKQQRSPPDGRDLSATETNICVFLQASGEPAEALPVCQHARELAAAVVGVGHPQTINTAENEASVLADLGRFDESCPIAERVLSFFRGLGQPADDRTSLWLTFGRCALHRGRPEEARRHLERALASVISGGTPFEIADVEQQLARAAFALGQRADAWQLAERAAARYASLPELAFRARKVRDWVKSSGGQTRPN
jgi:tetratricopeptide (TPR) repeat protein